VTEHAQMDMFVEKSSSADALSLSAGLALKAYDEEARTATFVASSDAIDTYGERVEQSWNLTRYMANPVVLFGHNSRDLPIGSAEMVAVHDGKLQVRVRFASEKANPMAEKVWQSVREKTLRAVSVGFIPGKVRTEREGDRDIYVLSDNELHEISVVPIPANPEALAKMKAKAIASAGANNGETHEAASSGRETAMADESKAALEAKERELAEAHKKVTEVSTSLTAMRNEKVAVESKLATTTNERDAAIERAKKAEAAVVAVELDALVGKKIAPTEVAGLKELAALSPDLYQRQVAAIKDRADMNLLSSVVPTSGAAALTNGLGADDEIVALMNG
jgi:HK97 family phage prohead protease